MLFKADVEQGPDGSSQIFIQPLLGCYSRAPSLREALQKAPSKIREYKYWLRSHGEETGADLVKVKICETVKGDWPVNLGDSVALFECDKNRLAQPEIDQYLRWMKYSWKDFQTLIEKVPKAAMDWKPSPDTIRSIRRIIIHTALVQVWYLMKLREKGDPPFQYPKGLSLWTYAKKIDRRHDISSKTLDGLRNAVCYRLRNLSDTEFKRITYHRPGGWTERTTPELWSARKVFRRFLWHERLHMNTIEKLLSAFDQRQGTSEI